MAAAWVGAMLAAELSAQSSTPRRLGDLSIEQLMNETVTSVSLRGEKLLDVPSAVSLVSHDDLERSGATYLWDALRSVPGVQVANQYAGSPAVSARGFNGVFSNKLLVLVDGRPVYTPLFGGVYWYLQQPLLEDLDRVEVIKGPGSSTWGANAVNGVINVESRSARETTGTFLAVDGGDYHRLGAAARQGVALGAATFGRVWVSRDEEKGFPNAATGRDPDWDNWSLGARVDAYRRSDEHLAFTTGYTDVDAGSYAQASNFNALARWVRGEGNVSHTELQAFFDHNEVLQPELMGLATDSFDVSYKQTVQPAERYTVTWGAGARELRDTFQQVSPAVILEHLRERNHVYNVFAQQEWEIVPERWTGTLGLKLEHNSLTQLEYQPSIRTSCRLAEAHHVWAAISRAVRSPSEFEGTRLGAVALGGVFQAGDGRLYVPRAVGDVNVKSEILWAYEAGYRFVPRDRWSLDVAAFVNRYSGLVAGAAFIPVPGDPLGVMERRAGNSFNASGTGGELAATFDVAPGCRLVASYSVLNVTIHEKSGANLDLVSVAAPRNQANLRAAFDLGSRGTLDVQVRYVGALDQVPGYLTSDLRLAWRFQPAMEFSLIGENLTAAGHREVPSNAIFPSSSVPARIRARVTWRF